MASNFDIVNMINNKLWEEVVVQKFIGKNYELVFEIQDYVFTKSTGSISTEHSVNDIFQHGTLKNLFIRLRKTLNVISKSCTDQYSDEELYDLIIYPTVKYILYPEHAALNTIHRN